ncbi:SDR family NAD(P)-dependent oxidoreductase [Nocardia higoensis]|uniref:SDR family NAD(P)-dependent oxidoreductase n=1 Tax=Nocardia higoensis TaxID=228599 RepID=A0ABS0DHM0_9NOCA|nr:SDR family NAD(P)-dependent oxidoreductase [Nocardia higoensis]MBF6357971.1 SDR family NAD(P)-dependent oxidoreductase [Nocardia higoensis]
MSDHYRGHVAVVTGAASGMGRELAVELARRGARLALCDVDAAGLAETAARCRVQRAEVLTEVVDVSQYEQVQRFADAVIERYGVVDDLFNNAGVGFVGTVERSELKDIARVVDIDFWGVVHGVKAFLPHLIASGAGRIANTSSVFGLFSAPSQSAYNAAKFAVRGFTESLRQEMLMAGHPVTVSVVYPGGIRTAIAANATGVDSAELADLAALFERNAMTGADRAARVILDGTAAGRPKILVGPDAKVADLMVRVLGASYMGLLAKAGARLFAASKR